MWTKLCFGQTEHVNYLKIVDSLGKMKMYDSPTSKYTDVHANALQNYQHITLISVHALKYKICFISYH